MDTISHIAGVANTANFTPGPTTPAPYNVPHLGMTDGTNPSNASKNMAELYNRRHLADDALVLEAGLSIDRNNWTQVTQAIQRLAASPVLGGLAINDFDLDPTTFPGGGEGRFTVGNTNPKGWNVGPGRMTFTADVQFSNYFAANNVTINGAHMACILRHDPATFTTFTRGHGAAFGNVSAAPEGTLVVPGAQLETVANGLWTGTERFLFPGSDSPLPLEDGPTYRITIESSMGYDLRRRLRLIIYKRNPTNTGLDLVCDTGDVQDHNNFTNFEHTGLGIAHVFGVPGATGWAIRYRNCKVVWGPPAASATHRGAGGGANARPPTDFFFEVQKTTVTNFGGSSGSGINTVAVWDTVTVPCSFGSMNPGKTVFTFSRGCYATVSGAMPVVLQSVGGNPGCSSLYRLNGVKQASGPSSNGGPGDLLVGGMPMAMTRRFEAGDTLDVLVEYSSNAAPSIAAYGSNSVTGVVKMTIVVHA